MFARAIGWGALAALVASVSATTTINSRQATNGSSDACATAGNAAGYRLGAAIKPSVALACLASVPLDVENDIELIDHLLPMVEMQSTLGYLKNPPESYLFPPIDLVGGLSQIREKLTKREYKSQLEFAWELNRLYNQVYDGHFDYKPGLLNVFGFQSSRILVSVSKDGVDLPKVYDLADLERPDNNTKGYTESEVVRIDGMAVVDYLQIVAANSALQDPDAQYNNLFRTSATLARGGGGYFRSGGYVELPDLSVYQYANGTAKSYPNFAILQQDLTGVRNGRHLHLAYEMTPPPGAKPKARTKGRKSKKLGMTLGKVLGKKLRKVMELRSREPEPEEYEERAGGVSTTLEDGGFLSIFKRKTQKSIFRWRKHKKTKSKKTKSRKPKNQESQKKRPANPTVPGYPYPVVKHYNDYIAGYFLNDTDYKDTAVLSIFSFAPRGAANRTKTELAEFRRVIRTFIEECRKASRTKLIIDVQANGGGLLFQAYELYRNLFPKAPTPWDGTRFRANDVWNVIGKQLYGSSSERMVFNNMLDRDEKRYSAWEAMFGPFETKEDKNTNILRYNFTHPTTTGEKGFIVSGYGPGDKPPEPHFEAKNIILVTDGFCASTCSILARLLTVEQGVRTLALGGRPLKAPMQAVGGVKGAQVMKYDRLQKALAKTVAKRYTSLNDTPVKIPKPLLRSHLPLLPSPENLQFNLRNAYRNASSQIPQQFVYEPAHCRRFYTYDMTRDPIKVWTTAADVAFRGSKCAEGSSTGPDGTMPSDPASTPALDRSKVFSKIPQYDGPGSKAYAERKKNKRDQQWVPAAKVARRHSGVFTRDLSRLELELLNRKPKSYGGGGWWDHPGY